jgi:acetylornithine/N-succinyldiaminopimelate aminotransferase
MSASSADPVVAMTERYQVRNYARFPVTFVRGEGSVLFDASGREYLDLLAGIAVAIIGHAHPGVARAVCRQAMDLVHVSNLFHVPVQGESGVRMPPPGYLETAGRLCRERGILLVADEIQAGLGRIGAMLGSAMFGAAPDIVTFAKGLANGLPLGAVVAREDVAAALEPGSHGSTFGGSPVCCAASRVVLETIAAPGFLDEVRRKGERFRSGLLEIASRRSDVREVRGAGLMLAMEMTVETRDIATRCLDNGLIVGSVAGTVLRFLPPLTVTDGEIERGLALLRDSLPEEGRR